MKHEHGQTLDPQMAQALGQMRYGLYFLLTGGLDQPRGMLVSWVSQISGQPPLIMAAVRHNRSLLPILLEQGSFSLCLLPGDDPGLVAQLGRPGPQRLEGLDLRPGPLDLPLLARAVGVLCCQIQEHWQPGDHVLLAARVAAALWQGPGPAFEAGQTGHAYLGLQ